MNRVLRVWCAAGIGGMLSWAPPLPGADTPVTPSSETILHSGEATLSCRVSEPVRVVFSADTSGQGMDAEVPTPLRIGVADSVGHTRWLEGSYTAVTREAGGLRGVGEIRSPAGSVFHFVDTYSPGPTPNAFTLARVVTVQNTAAADTGFMSRFGLRWTTQTALHDCEGFMPGVWYLDNRDVPGRALAANLDDARIWVRDDRLALPLVMLRRKSDGAALTLAHVHPDGSTAPQDLGPGPITDGRLQFASVGITTPTWPELSVVYPGAEGDRTYLREPHRPSAAGGSARFHPVQPGVRHEYQILLAIQRQPGYPQAMRWAWRSAYALAHPAIASVNLRDVYAATLHLLGNVAALYNGVPGLPFAIKLPVGTVDRSGKDISYQMGFVGQQLPAAYHLLRYGLLNGRSQDVHIAEAILDFWSAQSLTPEGLPRTWYNPFPQPGWRDYHTFLRVASDGMTGALQAWDYARRNGRDRPTWLKFCRGYGDWLLAHQAADGSWGREYDFASHVVNEGKGNTTHPIRFLVDLAAATGDRRYAESAVRAGEFCLKNVHDSFAYVGGTVDNPNVIDKEAGFMATDAFLALHDLTGDPRFLAAATQAADFMETWVYAWNVPPMPGATARGSLPTRLTMSGFSLIATGHSASDLFMAGAAFFYQRLYVATGDAHYLDVARLLLYNPRQFVDVNGSLGYGQPGLVTEALSLAPPRDGGVNVWLPWLSVSIVEPMVRLEETFGSMDLGPNAAAADQLANLRVRDAALARGRSAVWKTNGAR